MITKQEREQAFRHDLAELLAKHEAEMQVGDDGKDFGMHNGICEITMMTKWDEEGNQIAEYAEFLI